MEQIIIRRAAKSDAPDLHELYFKYLTQNPPPEEQSLSVWADMIDSFLRDPLYHLLLLEENGKVVSSVTVVIIKNLTHNLRPYAVVENVVTHGDFRGKGYATRLLDRASDIAREHNCYKIMLMTGSKKESTLTFYKNAGFDMHSKTAFDKRL